jgi:uncharacterized membrane protein
MAVRSWAREAYDTSNIEPDPVEAVMVPYPLHPAIVHFPIVLAVLLPCAGVYALLAIRRGSSPATAWLPVVGLAVLLAATSWLAVETGEREEDTVEDVVAESAIHEHEERAELFFPLTVIGLAITTAGLLKGRPGSSMRGIAVASALVITFAGYRVGHSGGELVYEHGAAAAYRQSPSRTPSFEPGEDEASESRESDREGRVRNVH